MPLTTLDPRTALVVVDVQNGFRSQPAAPHSADDVIARNVALADAFRARELPVILLRYTTNGAAPARTDYSGRGSGGTPPEGWDSIVDELAGHDSDVVITKYGWDSFHGTDLDAQLRSRGVTQLVLTGVATSIGVESTARAARDHGYQLTIPTDALTDLFAESHAHTTSRVFPMIAETGTTEEVLRLLAKTHS